jgi:hypothetical protein
MLESVLLKEDDVSGTCSWRAAGVRGIMLLLGGPGVCLAGFLSPRTRPQTSQLTHKHHFFPVGPYRKRFHVSRTMFGHATLTQAASQLRNHWRQPDQAPTLSA